MSKPWVSSITQKGELTVYNGLKSGAWVNIFKSALEAFNQLKLPVKMTAVASEQSANVVMRVSIGPTGSVATSRAHPVFRQR